MKKVYPIVVILILVLIYGCETREETKQPVACFTYSPENGIEVDDEISFTAACSEDAETYSWDFGDGTAERVGPTPTHAYSEDGEFEVTLTVENKNLQDQISKNITIEAGAIQIDPTDYGAIPSWINHYYNDFSEKGDWLEGSGDTWEATITGGYYTIKDTDASDDNFGRYYYTNEVELPDDNYDLEVIIRNTIDNGSYGSGLIFGLYPGDDSNSSVFNYYKFAQGYFNIGDTDGSWSEWTETSYGKIEDWNLLTVRKYKAKYYFFINQEYIFSDDYNDYGDQFGFIIDKDTHVDINAIGISIMDLSSNKSASKKQFTNTPRKIGGGKSIVIKSSLGLK